MLQSKVVKGNIIWPLSSFKALKSLGDPGAQRSRVGLKGSWSEFSTCQQSKKILYNKDHGLKEIQINWTTRKQTCLDGCQFSMWLAAALFFALKVVMEEQWFTRDGGMYHALLCTENWDMSFWLLEGLHTCIKEKHIAHRCRIGFPYWSDFIAVHHQ